jgi:hypothetical protein
MHPEITCDFIQPFCGGESSYQKLSRPFTASLDHPLSREFRGLPDFQFADSPAFTIATDCRILLCVPGALPLAEKPGFTNARVPMNIWQWLFTNAEDKEWGPLPELPEPLFRTVLYDDDTDKDLEVPITSWVETRVPILNRELQLRFLWKMSRCLPGVQVLNRPAQHDQDALVFRFPGGRGVLAPMHPAVRCHE